MRIQDGGSKMADPRWRMPKLRNLQPRSQALSPFPPLSSRRETLVAAGHVSMYTNQSRTRVGPQLNFSTGQFNSV